MFSIKEAKSLRLAQKPKTEHMVPIADEAAFTYHIEVEAPFATVIEYYFVRRILGYGYCRAGPHHVSS